MRIAVTGGAGFIGSHLVDMLVEEGHEVLVLDDLSSGKKENINPKATFLKMDIRKSLSKGLGGTETVFHLAAEPEVRRSATDPRKTFDINVKGTLELLDSCRRADVGRFIFTSTSAVYGEADIIPTPEDYPCRPISNYGASKLAGEAYLSAYSATYGIKGTSLRLANIYGERSTRGVMFDFFHKLRKNPERLEILGDGKQDKSYLYIHDCISAMLMAWKKQKRAHDVLNLGSREKKTVDEIAKLMCEELRVSPEIKYSGTLRSWAGDVPLMLLDVSKLESLGWKEQVRFKDGMKRYLRQLSSG